MANLGWRTLKIQALTEKTHDRSALQLMQGLAEICMYS